MVGVIPFIIFGDHWYKVHILKEGYFRKPHRTLFKTKKKPKKMKRLAVVDPAEGEGEGEGDKEKVCNLFTILKQHYHFYY